eukprot:CAMPEP_0201578414 /NCGR_PEP_ID=MMETSP0190_2-20130828/25257_1 /ASSEMBLY_ACC=CAM_ASM_000263 /TAXON_ID=37353 /ORGANISM="Rosalina sp." /LENGTH=446 /DNA_ID=CAMNT_0048011557 /DNA_START=124 /DNA_END=1464 /DNA_ORIENTATION=+
MATEDPPPYDPEADNQDDGAATATQQEETEAEPKPKKEKVPDEPPPDGEGELGPPLKRVYFIGGSLFLFCILSFWIPVYWLAGAVDPCRFACNTVQCYTSTVVTCSDTCDATCDALYANDISKDAYFTQWEASYLTSSRALRLTAFCLITVGLGLGFFGTIASYFAVKKGNGCYTTISWFLMIVCGILTPVGGLLFTIQWDNEIISASPYEELINAIHSAQFLEFLLPGVIAAIFALDLMKLILNDAEKRLMYLTVPMAIAGLYGGIIYAYIINWEPDADPTYEFYQYSQVACISAGYFIFGIMCIVRILVAKEKISLGDDPAKAIMYEFILSLFIVIGGFICAVGYWAFIDGMFETDTICDSTGTACSTGYVRVYTLSYLYGDPYQPGLYAAETADVNYESQFKAFYCGYSFFVLGVSMAIAYDMDIVGNYKKVRAAQGAAAAAS